MPRCWFSSSSAPWVIPPPVKSSLDVTSEVDLRPQFAEGISLSVGARLGAGLDDIGLDEPGCLHLQLGRVYGCLGHPQLVPEVIAAGLDVEQLRRVPDDAIRELTVIFVGSSRCGPPYQKSVRPRS